MPALFVPALVLALTSVSASVKTPLALNQAAKLIQKDKWSQSLPKLKLVQKNETWRDLAIWLSSEAVLKSFQKRDETQKPYPTETMLIQQTIESLTTLVKDIPTSVYLSLVQVRIGQLEAILARIQAKKKNGLLADKIFDRAFTRLFSQKQLFRLNVATLNAFSELCETNLNENCLNWGRKLYDFFPKNSPESKALRSHLTQNQLILALPLPPIEKQFSKAFKAPDQDQTAFDDAMSEYLKAEYREATKKFQKFLIDYARSTYKTRAQFWLAQSQLRRDEKVEAQLNFDLVVKDSPLSYYALLTALQFNKDPESLIPVQSVRSQSQDGYLEPLEKVRIEKTEALAKVGLNEQAAEQIEKIQPRRNLSNETLLYLAELSSKVGANQSSFRHLSELAARGNADVPSKNTLSLFFPKNYYETIEVQAKELGIDPILILSLVKQESAFDREAFSSSAALGLMQLMNFTAVEVDSTVEQADLFTPKTNIRLGTQYVAQLLKRFEGNYVYTLAGYNAGPHRVDKWLKDANPKWTPIEFIESIPFKETREYVGSIARNYFWYQWLINGKKLKSLDVFWTKTPAPAATPVPVKPQNGSA